MAVRRLFSAVHDGVHWRVMSSTHGVVGWRLDREWEVPGTTIDELLKALQKVRPYESMLAVGLPREQLVVRVTEPGTTPVHAFPQGLDLVVWHRTVEHQGRLMQELIGIPRVQVRRYQEAAVAQGFTAFALFPIWVAAVYGQRSWAPGSTAELPTGRIVRQSREFGPWEDDQARDAASTTGAVWSLVLRGGLLLALSRMPREWSWGSPRSRGLAPILLVALLLGCVAWVGAQWWRVEYRIDTLERQRESLMRSTDGTAPGLCTVGDLMASVERASACGGGIVLERLQFAGDGQLTVTGHGSSTAAVTALEESLGVEGAEVVVEQGTRMQFKLQGTVPCAH